MRTREDVEREVTRMLADDSIRKPRILRFFRDYFDHDLAGYICKDTEGAGENGSSRRQQPLPGHVRRGGEHGPPHRTDPGKDRDVLEELLTTQQVVATRADNTYFGRQHTPEERKVALAAKKAEDEALKKEIEARPNSRR